jgi:hypothetical protein
VADQLRVAVTQIEDIGAELVAEKGEHAITVALLTASEAAAANLGRDLDETTAALQIVRGELQSIQDEKAEARVIYWRRQKGLKGQHDYWLDRYKGDPARFEEEMALIPDSLLAQQISGTSPHPQPAYDYATMTSRDLDTAATRLAAETGRTYDACWSELRNKMAAHQRSAKTSRHEE